MGILPLQFLEGQTASTLGLTGREKYTINIPEDVKPGQIVEIEVHISFVQCAFANFLLNICCVHRFVGGTTLRHCYVSIQMWSLLTSVMEVS